MTIETKIENILSEFGMSGKKAAEAMGISYAVFRNRKSGTPGNHFSEENLQDLKDFIKEKAEELK